MEGFWNSHRTYILLKNLVFRCGKIEKRAILSVTSNSLKFFTNRLQYPIGLFSKFVFLNAGLGKALGATEQKEDKLTKPIQGVLWPVRGSKHGSVCILAKAAGAFIKRPDSSSTIAIS